ncbi:hypothetical protein GE061_012395 [Apolygus lucorum]|uniref:Uncharacterized protein n=1 Tax=Apolygus lucorum TaxID=248454 RepID=A0A8S9XTJ4_APOLU|nr:hypothetical protein GE061_012395 [Apolygus lucorum]
MSYFKETSYAENHRELTKVKTELVELKKHYQETVAENQILKKNASNLQMNQVRNKSPFGLSGFSDTAGRSFQRGSAFLTPSPSSISGSEIPSQGRSRLSTPDSHTKRIFTPVEKTSFNNAGFRQSESLKTPRSSNLSVNSQPFVLSSQPPQTQYSGRSSRSDATSRSWSSGTSSRNTTKTIRKSRDSFISKLNNSSIY